MDTAGSEHLATMLGSQAARITKQEEQLSSLSRVMTALAESQDGFATTVTTQLGVLSGQIQQLVRATQAEQPETPAPEQAPVPTLTHAPSELHLPPPERYSGEQGRCKPFITECNLHYELFPQHFSDDRAKTAFMLDEPGWESTSVGDSGVGTQLQDLHLHPRLPGGFAENFRPRSSRSGGGSTAVWHNPREALVV